MKLNLLSNLPNNLLSGLIINIEYIMYNVRILYI